MVFHTTPLLTSEAMPTFIEPSAARTVAASELAKLDLVKVPGSLEVHSRNRQLGSVSLWQLYGRSCEFEVVPMRGTEQSVSFVFVESGLVSARSPGERWNPLNASLFVMPTVEARRIRLRGAWQVTIAKMPLRSVDAFVPFVPSHVGVFQNPRLLDEAMHQFVRTVLHTDSPGSALESRTIEQLVIEMAGAVLLDRIGPDWGQGTPHDALRDRALSFISQHCTDPMLAPALVAQRVQASLRQLQAVFAESGTSIASEVRRARARAAHVMLADCRFDAMSVEQVAEKSGFATSMSLRRAMEEVYQQSPRAVRESRAS